MDFEDFGATTTRKVRIGTIFARKVLLEAIFGAVLGGWGPWLAYAAKWGAKWGAKSGAKWRAKSTPKSMAIPRLISEVKSRKSLEIMEGDKN